MAEKYPIQTKDGYELTHLHGRVVAMLDILYDGGACILLKFADAKSAGYFIRITFPCTIAVYGKEFAFGEKVSDPVALTPFLHILGRRIERLSYSKEGVLRVDFDRELYLTVFPDAEYESWEVNEADYFICGPGGEEIRFRN